MNFTAMVKLLFADDWKSNRAKNITSMRSFVLCLLVRGEFRSSLHSDIDSQLYQRSVDSAVVGLIGGYSNSSLMPQLTLHASACSHRLMFCTASFIEKIKISDSELLRIN